MLDTEQPNSRPPAQSTNYTLAAVVATMYMASRPTDRGLSGRSRPAQPIAYTSWPAGRSRTSRPAGGENAN